MTLCKYLFVERYHSIFASLLAAVNIMGKYDNYAPFLFLHLLKLGLIGYKGKYADVRIFSLFARFHFMPLFTTRKFRDFNLQKTYIKAGLISQL